MLRRALKHVELERRLRPVRSWRVVVRVARDAGDDEPWRRLALFVAGLPHGELDDDGVLLVRFTTWASTPELAERYARRYFTRRGFTVRGTSARQLGTVR